MDHSEAIGMGAAERYVLGDLSVSEVEEFERHFFDCPQCSEELRTLSVLQDNARAVFLEPSPEPVPASLPASEGGAGWRKDWADRWWRRWLAPALVPALAMLAIGIFAGYETGVRRGATVQPVSAFPLYAASRGEETAITPPRGAQFYTLYMDRTWDRDFVSYQASIRSENGKEKFSIDLDTPAPGKAIHVLIPRAALGSGKYSLIIFGADLSGRQTEAARYPFTLRIE